MRLLRDLWTTSRSRSFLAMVLIVLGAAAQAGALALAGAVLVDRSMPLFTVLAAALVASVLSDVFVGLVAAGLTADWAARVRRGLVGEVRGGRRGLLLGHTTMKPRVSCQLQLLARVIRISRVVVALSVGRGTVLGMEFLDSLGSNFKVL